MKPKQGIPGRPRMDRMKATAGFVSAVYAYLRDRKLKVRHLAAQAFDGDDSAGMCAVIQAVLGRRAYAFSTLNIERFDSIARAVGYKKTNREVL